MPTFMKTINTLPTNPTARMFINGLAVGCFSRLYERAEVGFLQVEDHPLTFTIYNSECIPQFNTPFELYSGTAIKINSNNPGLGALYHPTAGDDPEDSDDSDFRHLINLDKLHREVYGSAQVVLKPNFYIAKLYLSGGVFFNGLRSRYPATIIGDVTTPRSGRIAKPMQRVGKVIAASLTDKEIVIDISSQPAPITLTDADGPYTIIIRYKCDGRGSSETDFQQFHNVLDLPRDQQLDLVYSALEPPELIECEKNLEKVLAPENHTEKDMKIVNLSRFFRTLRTSEEACQASTKPECPTNLQGIQENC